MSLEDTYRYDTRSQWQSSGLADLDRQQDPAADPPSPPVAEPAPDPLGASPGRSPSPDIAIEPATPPPEAPTPTQDTLADPGGATLAAPITTPLPMAPASPAAPPTAPSALAQPAAEPSPPLDITITPSGLSTDVSLDTSITVAGPALVPDATGHLQPATASLAADLALDLGIDLTLPHLASPMSQTVSELLDASQTLTQTVLAGATTLVGETLEGVGATLAGLTQTTADLLDGLTTQVALPLLSAPFAGLDDDDDLDIEAVTASEALGAMADAVLGPGVLGTGGLHDDASETALPLLSDLNPSDLIQGVAPFDLGDPLDVLG